MTGDQPDGTIHIRSEEDESHSTVASSCPGADRGRRSPGRSPIDGDEYPCGSPEAEGGLMAVEQPSGLIELQDNDELVYATWIESPLADRGFLFTRGEPFPSRQKAFPRDREKSARLPRISENVPPL